MQQLIIAGNVGKDAVLRTTGGGDHVLGFSLAVDGGKDKDGNKRTAMDVRVNDIALQGGKRDEAPRQAAPAAERKASTNVGRAAVGGFADMDDDIPFRDPMANRAFSLIA